jgi:hypothetical protein
MVNFRVVNTDGYRGVGGHSVEDEIPSSPRPRPSSLGSSLKTRCSTSLAYLRGGGKDVEPFWTAAEVVIRLPFEHKVSESSGLTEPYTWI